MRVAVGSLGVQYVQQSLAAKTIRALQCPVANASRRGQLRRPYRRNILVRGLKLGNRLLHVGLGLDKLHL